MQRFGDMPSETPQPAPKNYILHGELVAGDMKIYFSDSPNNVAQGENVTILIDCASEEEVDRLYAALSLGAEIRMTLQKTFWKAKYANLKDKFGVSWQLNYLFA